MKLTLNITVILIVIFISDPALTYYNGWNSRVSARKCQMYTELIAKNVTFGPMSLFGTSRTEKKYDCNSFAGMIVGGVEARPGEFPHMAALGVRDSNGSVRFICGGSLISEWFVLTAAHCFGGDEINIVRLGDHDLSTTTDKANHTDYPVWDLHVHEEYDLLSKINDIALIELKFAVKFSRFIRPACLYQSKAISGSVIATGWGQLGTYSDTSDVLMKVNIDTVYNRDCNVKISFNGYSLYESQFCAGGKGRNDTCHGDSGGPIQLFHPPHQCIYDIVGITAYGQINCGSEVPSVYTRVAYYLDWIENIVWPSTLGKP